MNGEEIRPSYDRSYTYRRLRKSGEFLLLINLTSNGRSKKKTQAIFSFSHDEKRYNLTLSQKSDRYILRISRNGDHDDVEFSFGQVRRGQLQQIAVTFDGRIIECVVDGKVQRTKEVDVRFSEWNRYPIVLGSKSPKDRRWSGTVHSLILLPTSDHEMLADFVPLSNSAGRDR